MEKRLTERFEEALKSGVPLSVIQTLCDNQQAVPSKSFKYIVKFFVLLPVCVGILCFVLVEGNFEEWECLLEQNEITMEISRPLFDCHYCEQVHSVPIFTDISAEDFEQYYAYTGIPIVVAQGAKQWSATRTFSVKFFKEVYHSNPEYLSMANEECQFIPYLTAWENLGDALNMSDDQAVLNGDQWYIGW